MERLWKTAACAALLLPQLVAAQVEKRVEVTKAYVPKVESASKLSIEPDMTDTTRMRPEIDYTVTPLSLRTTLTTRPIRPATVTYWEFNRPLPFYVKAGVGYPLNSVLDFYASTQNPSTGYLVGYVNHEGRYAKIANDFDVKNNSTRMYNRIGVAAGKYFGRHTLGGEFSYDNRLYHRYGAWAPEETGLGFGAGAMNDYGDAEVLLRFGDDFQDMDRLNFEVSLHGGLYLDHSDHPVANMQGRESLLGLQGRIGQSFGRSTLWGELGYEHSTGQKYLADNGRQLVHVGLHYGFEGGTVRLNLGATYYWDRIETFAAPDSQVERGDYIIPRIRLDFNLGTAGLKPFIEADGAVRPNDFRALTMQNPFLGSSRWLYRLFESLDPPLDAIPGYTGNSLWLDRSSVDYDFRLGIGGSLWRSRFNYRMFAGFSVHDNHLFWTGWQVALPETGCDVLFLPVMARQTVTSFNGEVEFRPVSALKFDLGFHGYLYNDETPLKNGAPAFAGHIGMAYDARKIAFGVQAWMQSERSWTVYRYMEQPVDPEGVLAEFETLPAFKAPFGVDLRAWFDWRITGRVTLFAEGRNLLNRPLYEQAWFPELGACFTVGVKANF